MDGTDNPPEGAGADAPQASPVETKAPPEPQVGDRVRLADGRQITVMGVRRTADSRSLMIAGGSWIDGAGAIVLAVDGI